MKASELRTKSAAELGQELESLLKAQFGLRMQRATQQLTNHTQIGKVRRDIARVRTLMTEKAAKEYDHSSNHKPKASTYVGW